MRSLGRLVSVAALALGTAAGGNGFFAIDGNHAGKLVVGMPQSQIYRLYPRLRTRQVDLQLEGIPTPAIEIFLASRSDPALVVRLTGPGSTVDEIQVKDSRFRDEAGIHVGSTFGELRRACNKLELAVSEGQYCVFTEGTGLSYCLAVDDKTETALDENAGDIARIPDSTPVQYLVVFGRHSSHGM